MTPEVVKFELTAADGGELPAFEAGAHIDVVIAPEYLRAYSLAGDPADVSRWVLGVQREAPEQGGRGGSALMHRAFREGRTLFVSQPRNLFALHEDASMSWLFAGGIGITPLLTMAHRLHKLGRPFALHYSAASRAAAGFIADIEAAPWREQAHFHFSQTGQRADLAALVPAYGADQQLYSCGSARYMDAVFAAAAAAGWPAEAMHREYFSLPEAPPRENHAFVLRLLDSGRELAVPAERSATEVLSAAGLKVEVKCSDGLCGVCAAAYDPAQSDAIEHRDVVLSQAERGQRIVLCCSRAADAGGVIALRL